MILALYLLGVLAICMFVSALIPGTEREDPIWGDDDE